MRGLLSTIPAACGLMPAARLGTGTASNATVLRGDQTYAALAVGTTGTDVNVSTGASDLTVNVPDAGASARGVVSTGTQTFGGAKTFRQVTITGTSDNVELNVRAYSAGQGSHLQTWRDKDGVLLGTVSSVGVFDLGAGGFGQTTIGFYGVTKISRPTTAFTPATFTANAGTAINNASTFDGYTVGQVVAALKALGLLT